MSEPIKMIVVPESETLADEEKAMWTLTNYIGSSRVRILLPPGANLMLGRSYELVLTPVQTREERLREALLRAVERHWPNHMNAIVGLVEETIREFEEREKAGNGGLPR